MMDLYSLLGKQVNRWATLSFNAKVDLVDFWV